MSIARSVTRSVARPVASSPIRGGGAGGEPPEPSTDNLLLEDGDALLLEDGDELLLEDA